MLLLLWVGHANAQEDDERLRPGKGRINVQLVAGILNSTPVGIEAAMIRNGINEMEDANSSYSGSLLPKTSAYVGFNIDYQFHKVGAIGTGLTYTPKGYWLFENDEATDTKSRVFITVDYFEIPIFYKEYFKNDKLSLRFGPVVNLTVISKNRTITTIAGEEEKEKSRLGENGDPLPREVVPGFEAALGFGNIGGFHGDFQFQYMGSTFGKDIDLRSVVFKVGVGYTFSK